MAIFQIHFLWFQISPTWYGLMYFLGFLSWFLILQRRWFFTRKELDSLILYIFLWVVLWWRIGYVLFYNLPYFIEHPSKILSTWEGGMSFHGWTIGVIIALILYATFKKKWLFLIADEVTSVLPIGLGLWRIGNYINGELLWYANYNGPFSILRNNISYFPSTLLEAFLEGIILYILLQIIYKFRKHQGEVAAVFLIAYWILRSFSELFRLPDSHIGYLLWTNWITMWHILSLPMILIGIILLLYLKNKENIKH